MRDIHFSKDYVDFMGTSELFLVVNLGSIQDKATRILWKVGHCIMWNQRDLLHDPSLASIPLNATENAPKALFIWIWLERIHCWLAAFVATDLWQFGQAFLRKFSWISSFSVMIGLDDMTINVQLTHSLFQQIGILWIYYWPGQVGPSPLWTTRSESWHCQRLLFQARKRRKGRPGT